jgi:hypothetical protein
MPATGETTRSSEDQVVAGCALSAAEPAGQVQQSTAGGPKALRKIAVRADLWRSLAWTRPDDLCAGDAQAERCCKQYAEYEDGCRGWSVGMSNRRATPREAVWVVGFAGPMPDLEEYIRHDECVEKNCRCDHRATDRRRKSPLGPGCRGVGLHRLIIQRSPVRCNYTVP